MGKISQIEINNENYEIKDNDALPLTGGTLTGPLELAADPTTSMQASTKKYVDDEIADLRAGGRNLIAETSEGGLYVGSSKDVWTGTTIVPPTETEYVVSFDAKANEAMDIYCYFYSPNTTLTSESSTGDKRTDATDGVSKVSVTTEWQRYWVKWTQTAASTVKQLIVGRNNSTSALYIKAVKLEEGNIPSAWSPAPEDNSTPNVFVQADAPSNPKEGDLWVDTDDAEQTVLAAVATSGSFNDLTDKPTYGISNITGLQTALDAKANSSVLASYLPLSGGTMSGPLILTGGDAASGVGNMQLDTNGQITAKGSTETLFGRSGTNNLLLGHSSYSLTMRGSGAAPTYNGANLATQAWVQQQIAAIAIYDGSVS